MDIIALQFANEKKLPQMMEEAARAVSAVYDRVQRKYADTHLGVGFFQDVHRALKPTQYAELAVTIRSTAFAWRSSDDKNRKWVGDLLTMHCLSLPIVSGIERVQRDFPFTPVDDHSLLDYGFIYGIALAEKEQTSEEVFFFSKNMNQAVYQEGQRLLAEERQVPTYWIDKKVAANIRQFKEDHIKRLGTEPTTQEVARGIKVEIAQVVALTTVEVEQSLEQSIPLVIDESANIDQVVDNLSVIRAGFESLTDREKDILTKRFGLGGEPPKTLEEIGAEYRLTQESIRRIEAKALSRFRNRTYQR